MSNLPNQEISGLSTEFLDWVTDESEFRCIMEEFSSEYGVCGRTFKNEFTRCNGVLKFMAKKWMEEGGKNAGKIDY